MGDNTGAHIRISGALAGVGSGLTKVAVGHGCVGVLITFDTIKTRMQCSPPGTYHGAIDVLTKTIRNEGVTALYKGVTPQAVGWAAIDSVLLGSLHNYRLFLLRHGMTEVMPGTEKRRLTLFAHGIAGLFAGLTSAMVATPVELLKVKLQLQLQRKPADRQFKSAFDCARQIVRTQGIFGLWTGFTGTLAFRSNFFWMFLGFEWSMRGFSQLNGTSYEISTGTANFLSGGLGSFALWGFGIPADNVKNQMMSHPLTLPPQSTFSRPSFLSVTRRIHATHGAVGFFRGLTPTLLRAFPMNASAIFVYEGMMRSMGAEQTRS